MELYSKSSLSKTLVVGINKSQLSAVSVKNKSKHTLNSISSMAFSNFFNCGN
ncbi:hypothetical protein SDC9_175392 [bioreactor metagenome]|uniref:Uncharacterized protein n=1 Tax=bioreactor metagenome TaxID=1076179 RepID=A0A645GM11_9ZZZZ